MGANERKELTDPTLLERLKVPAGWAVRWTDFGWVAMPATMDVRDVGPRELGWGVSYVLDTAAVEAVLED
jgi:hypothetical protein